MVAGAYGPVPATLPQTSQAAEFSALVMAISMLEGTAHIFCDCASVVRCWSLGALSAKDHKATYSGLIQEARQSSLSELVNSVTWDKAHQSLSAVVRSGDPIKIQLARGNDNAETAANKGSLMHAQPDQPRR